MIGSLVKINSTFAYQLDDETKGFHGKFSTIYIDVDDVFLVVKKLILYKKRWTGILHPDGVVYWVRTSNIIEV